MPFNNTKNKAIQISIATDNKLVNVINKVQKDLNIRLASRDAAIDMLASKYLES